jgi:hypothetical protein
LTANDFPASLYQLVVVQTKQGLELFLIQIFKHFPKNLVGRLRTVIASPDGRSPSLPDEVQLSSLLVAQMGLQRLVASIEAEILTVLPW